MRNALSSETMLRITGRAEWVGGGTGQLSHNMWLLATDVRNSVLCKGRDVGVVLRICSSRIGTVKLCSS